MALHHEKVSVKDIHVDPQQAPKKDERLLDLMGKALRGEVLVYFAAIPLGQCLPFDVDYRPDLHPVGQHAIREVCEAWQRGEFPKLIAYQRGRWFVISDDYIPLFATLEGLPDYVPCWVLGKPDCKGPKDVQGPISQGDVGKALGLE